MNAPLRNRVTETRRDFFRRSLRRVALAGLAATGAVLGYRRLRDPETCVNQGLCRGCGVFAGCGLPQALSAKQVLGRGTLPDLPEQSQPSNRRTS